jgi:hypothetical protein
LIEAPISTSFLSFRAQGADCRHELRDASSSASAAASANGLLVETGRFQCRDLAHDLGFSFTILSS